MRRRATGLCLLMLAAAAVARAAAAQEIGTVVGVEGRAEIGRGGTWSPATVGAGIQLLDALRTDPATGRLAVVFHEGSMLNIGRGSELAIEEFAATGKL